MSKPATLPPRVEPLRITQMLLNMLVDLPVERRREVFAKAKVPFASYHAWRLGYYHPSVPALERLFRVLGCALTVIVVDARL